MLELEEVKIAVLGLGYVGLPLAVEFGNAFPTVGFDIKAERVAELRAGHDSTLEVNAEELAEAKQLSFADQETDLADCNVFIATVPTPIDRYKRPDLTPSKAPAAHRPRAQKGQCGDLRVYRLPRRDRRSLRADHGARIRA